MNLGLHWPSSAPEFRKIALISMPCDSAAAGLIALGALARDLGRVQSNDLSGRFESLLRFSTQFLRSCRSCALKCDPALKGCGHTQESTGLIRHRDDKRYETTAIELDSRWGPAIACSNKHERRLLFESSAGEWRIDGEPAPQTSIGGESLDGGCYSQIFGDANVLSSNLLTSFSGLCLAGHGTGERSTRDRCESVRFRIHETEYPLSELLTVQGWGVSRRVSRITYYNARTEGFDRYGCAPSLVIADGEASFLKVLERIELQRSDVIGVIHRTIERNRLESIGAKMADLGHWYVNDHELERKLATMRAIHVRVLKSKVT